MRMRCHPPWNAKKYYFGYDLVCPVSPCCPQAFYVLLRPT